MPRKFLIFLVTTWFSSLLFLTVISSALSSTFTASNFKKWLNENHVYQNVVDSAIKENKNENIGSKNVAVKLKQTEVKSAIKKTFTPQLLQKISEEFIDGTEPWLKGKVDKPDFKIDLRKAKNDLAENVVAATRKSYSRLPACQGGVVPSSSNVLEASCRVSGFDIEPELKHLESEIKNSRDFLPNPILTADNLEFDQNKKSKTKTQPFYKKYKNLPTYYRLARLAPLIFGLLSIIFAAGLLWLSRPRRNGFRRVAVSLLVSGLVLLISVLVINGAFGRAETAILKENKDSARLLTDSVLPLLRDVKGLIIARVNTFIIVFLLLSAGLFVYLAKTRQSKATKTTKNKAI